MSKRFKIGLALGGGGARGLAHIGVLKVLEREGIPIDLIVGTSMGALIGAAYAIKPDALALERQALRFFSHESKKRTTLRLLDRIHAHHDKQSDLIHRLVRIAKKELALSLVLVRKALVSEREMGEILQTLLPRIDLVDTKIPYAATAVDLVSGREIILNHGSLIRAVTASCAVPGFMAPVRWDEMVLVDGGVTDVLPAGPAKTIGADIILGVDVGPCLYRPYRIGDGFDEIQRVTDIMVFYLSRQQRACCDVLIEPTVNQVHWTDFFEYEQIIREGEKATESRIEEIREILKPRFRRTVFHWAREVLGLKDKGDHKKLMHAAHRMVPSQILSNVPRLS